MEVDEFVSCEFDFIGVVGGDLSAWFGESGDSWGGVAEGVAWEDDDEYWGVGGAADGGEAVFA